jgi:hypothetical protein
VRNKHQCGEELKCLEDWNVKHADQAVHAIGHWRR